MAIDKALVTAAKARAARWFDSADEPHLLRRKFLSGIDAIAKEIPNRANWYEVITARLDDSANCACYANAENYRVFTSATGLVVSTVVPGWNFGWGKILPDDEARNVLTWFLHYARQYVHRSYVAATLMMVWEYSQKVLHPFGSQGMYQRYGPVRPMTSNKTVLDAAQREALKEWGAPLTTELQKLSSPWMERNTLDPYIHQAIFHYLRAQNLLAADFETEAVIAFDCAIQSIGSLLRVRRHLPKELSRIEICQELGLSHESSQFAEHAYFIRNNFGAHAGGWRWWDQSELFEDFDITEIAKATQTALSNAADQEPKFRAVEPNPPNWPRWLFENFDALWDAVWFDKLSAR